MQMVMLWIKMWIESLGRLPTYLLMRGSSPNVVHKCNLFLFLFFFFFIVCFFGKKWVQDMLTCGHDKMRILIVILNFGHAPQRSMNLNLDVLPRGPRIWILDMLPRGPMDLRGIIHADICGPFTLVPAK